MDRAFFAAKFQRDEAFLLQWLRFLEEKEDELTPEIRLAFSQIINSHHIWNCRLRQVLPESALSDTLPVTYWQQLLRANFRETIAFIDDHAAEEKVRFHDSEGAELEQLTSDLLFQLLQDSAFYRGQLTLLADRAGFQTPLTDTSLHPLL